MEPRAVLARLAELGTPPDAESALRISVGLDQTIARFQGETLPFVADGGAELQFVFAPYGRGKTHFLKTLQEVARRQGFATAYIDCRTDQAPFASLQETYRIVASNMLPTGTISGLSRSRGPEAIIAEALLAIPGERVQERIASLQHDQSLVPDFRNVVVAYSRTTLLGQPTTSIQQYLHGDLGALLSADPTRRVRVAGLYQDHSWLPRPLGKLGRRNAACWLRSLCSLPRSLGYPGLVVLFDETELTHSLIRQGAKQRRSYLANLRNFVDHLAQGNFRSCAIYYAVVEEFLETARFELEALSQRIERVRFSSNGHGRNPRAVWVDLDELTRPSPESEGFYEQLAKAIADLGIAAGLPGQARERILGRISTEVGTFSKSINTGAVREFVKRAASLVGQEVYRNV